MNYTAKDLLQYALAIGCSSDGNPKELRYTFEEDANFEAFPSFCFALPSWASTDGLFSYVQPFPTPLMKNTGVIPSECLKDDADIGGLPVIHISQSAAWHRSLPVPPPRSGDRQVHALVSSRVLSVTPKLIGCFVETETRIRTTCEPLCTLSSTLLVLGMDPSRVTPLTRKVQLKSPRDQSPPKSPPTLEWSYTTTQNQALLYRLASGDFNAIHVDPSTTSSMMEADNDKPILHGLCTLGIALRGLLQRAQEDTTFASLHARFTKPVFVGDKLTVHAWQIDKDSEPVLFRVLNANSGAMVLEGSVFRKRNVSKTTTTSNRSKL